MYERSAQASSQDGQAMRFSDEASVAEVARLMSLVQRGLAVVSGGAGPFNESGADEEWLR